MKADAQIQRGVLDELAWDTHVAPNEVGVTVHAGVVTLTGTVSGYATKLAAEAAARRITGVLGVANELVVTTDRAVLPDPIAADTRRALDDLLRDDQPTISPQTIRSAIHDALERRADRDADRIDIDIEGGRVTLHGVVQSWREREAIVGAARGTPGVRTVVDRMRLG